MGSGQFCGELVLICADRCSGSNSTGYDEDAIDKRGFVLQSPARRRFVAENFFEESCLARKLNFDRFGRAGKGTAEDGFFHYASDC